MAELVRKYADFPLGSVYAAVLAVAERLEVLEVAALDLRHFSAVRTRHLYLSDFYRTDRSASAARPHG